MISRARNLVSLSLTAMMITGLTASSPAVAQVAHPVAIVEEASAGSALSPFEYLIEGQTIQLSHGDEVVIGYFSSCRLERISGGTLTIGRTGSTVVGGQISAQEVNCSGGTIELTPETAAQSGVAVYRAPAEESLVLYSATPAFLLNGASRGSAIEIERLDRDEAVRRLPTTGRLVDMSAGDLPLNPGGLYVARHGNAEQTFRVVVYGRPGGSLLSRLVQF